MSTDPDEEALTWPGDSSLDLPERPRAKARAASADRDGIVADDAGQSQAAVPGTSAVALVAYGVIGGIYLLYTVGWVISVIRDPFTMANLFAEIMRQFGEFLAIAAPLVWMAATVLLTRGRRTLVRLGWLIAGVLLLLPVPFLLGGF